MRFWWLVAIVDVWLSVMKTRILRIGRLCLFMGGVAWGALVTAQPLLTAPFVGVRAYYLLEVESDQPLATLNPDQRVEPASLTKLMTAYLIFQALHNQQIHPDQRVTPSTHAWKMPGSRMFIDPGKPVTINELIHGLIIESGNDAGVALAETLDGTEGHFVERMNAMAKTLGMNNTHFANATGLPDEQHYSTAHDLALLARALIHTYPDYYALYGQKEYTYGGITQANRNRLLWMDPSVDGLKTGHTDSAGYCLISSAQRGQRRLLAVVLGASSDLGRTTDSQTLLNWGFQTFQSQRLFAKGQVVKTLPVYKGQKTMVSVGFSQDVWLTTPVGHENEAKKTLTTWQPILAPVNRQQKLGNLQVIYGGQVVTSADLVALEDIPVGNAFTRIWDSVRLMLK